MSEIIEQHTFRQPSGAVIVIRRWDTPYFHPYTCERLLNGRRQQVSYGCEDDDAKRLMREWAEFEQTLGSVEL